MNIIHLVLLKVKYLVLINDVVMIQIKPFNIENFLNTFLH